MRKATTHGRREETTRNFHSLRALYCYGNHGSALEGAENQFEVAPGPSSHTVVDAGAGQRGDRASRRESRASRSVVIRPTKRKADGEIDLKIGLLVLIRADTVSAYQRISQFVWANSVKSPILIRTRKFPGTGHF